MVFRDVTDRKILQQQLELADRLASLGTMAAGVAHEVNNPLTTITGNASLVREELAARVSDMREGRTPTAKSLRALEEAADAVGDMEAAAVRIRQIVADLKAFSRPSLEPEGAASVERAIDWALRSTAHELRYHANVLTSCHRCRVLASTRCA